MAGFQLLSILLGICWCVPSNFGQEAVLFDEDCWWTGCQRGDWAVQGCGVYGREERLREPCEPAEDGMDQTSYFCCLLPPPPPLVPLGEEELVFVPTPSPEEVVEYTEPPPVPTTAAAPSNSTGNETLVSFQQFSDAVTSNGYAAPTQEQYNNFNLYAQSLGRISSVQEAAMALAQLIHESGGLLLKRQVACATSGCPGQYEFPGCDAQGQRYFGRGYIQLSWCYNYREASLELFGDNRLVLDPDQVAANDDVSWQTSFWYWGSRVHDQSGVEQGQFGVTTRAINGIECIVAGDVLAARRFQIYGNVRGAFGLSGAGDPSGCA